MITTKYLNLGDEFGNYSERHNNDRKIKICVTFIRLYFPDVCGRRMLTLKVSNKDTHKKGWKKFNITSEDCYGFIVAARRHEEIPDWGKAYHPAEILSPDHKKALRKIGITKEVWLKIF